MNDTVLIWFDPEHGEPDYEIPPLADFFPAGATDSQGWTKGRSEEHTSELQSLMRISYAVFCLKKKKTHTRYTDQQAKISDKLTTRQQTTSSTISHEDR